MDFLVKLIINWLLLDVLIIATIWWAGSTLRPMFPQWWKAHICDIAPTHCE